MKYLIRLNRSTIALIVFATVLLTSWSVVAEEEIEFSTAETILWLTDQLKTISKPLVLTYAFERSGTYDPGFRDTVRFNVDAIKSDGMKAASVEFFTGERRFEVPPVESTNVNPVLKIYLQGDVYEMNRLTDAEGKSRERWRYFQRRIKFALADTATVEPTEIEFNGKRYAGKMVSFRPYVDDPKRALFEQFADKSYRIIVSDDLPGYLYRIETIIPSQNASGPPLIKEELQLVDVAEQAATDAAKEL